MGRVLKLKGGLSLEECLESISNSLGLNTSKCNNFLVRFTRGLSKRSIERVAICAGSGNNGFLGSSVLKNADADLFITGEMGHHDLLYFSRFKKSSCILMEHTNSERGYLSEIFREKLKSQMVKNFEFQGEVYASECDIDPIEFFSH